MSSRSIFIIFLAILIIIGSIFSIKLYLPFLKCPQEVRSSINQADGNYLEIITACRHFQSEGDSTKLNALYFLLQNMNRHLFAEAAIQDEQGNIVEFDSSLYKDLDEAKEALDKFEQNTGELSWHLKKAWKDQDTITADLLIENIDEAYLAWKTLPWSKSYSEDVFYNYILPYRGSNEPLGSFRPFFLEMFNNIRDIDDPVEAAAVINDSLKSIFSFNAKYYLHPTDQSFTEMLAKGEGRCEDMTNFAIYAMRANGIAVTSDYTPHWADSGNNHAWNAVLDEDGRAIPFMGCEGNPGKYKLRNRIAKVYRKMFAEQPSSLGCQLEENEEAPAWLGGKSYLDVTTDYVQTDDITVIVDSLPPETQRFLYLVVFNSGNWEAIAWSRLEENRSVFHDIGIDLIYLPCYYLAKELVPAGEAFLLNSDGRMEELKTSNNLIDMKLYSTTRMKIKNLTGESDITNLRTDKEYELYYWDKKWVHAATKTYRKTALIFNNIPGDGLYWLREKDSDKEERIFIYRNDQQIWY